MQPNNFNETIHFKHIVNQKNPEPLAEALFETAAAGFKQGAPWTVHHFWHALEAENSVIFTASLEEDGTEKIIGALIAGVMGAEAEIYLVVVDQAHQQKRIASQLFEHLLAWLREHAVLTVYLEVRLSNKPALGLYQALGFERVGVRKKYYTQPVEDAFVMRLEL